MTILTIRTPKKGHWSYSLNSLKGGYIRNYIGDYCRGHYKVDTRSLEYGSFRQSFSGFMLRGRPSTLKTLNPKLEGLGLRVEEP